MKPNLGKYDRIIRFLAAIGIAVLYFTHLISGQIAIILGVVAVAFIITSFINFCPIYAALGISTRKDNQD